jgi:hydrogenase maturation protease
MTVRAPVRPDFAASGPGRDQAGLSLVDVLVCGSPERGDDGAALAALARLVAILPADVRVRVVGRLEVDHLLAVPLQAGVVVVDTATGVDPGRIVRLPLRGLVGRETGLRLRSSYALAVPEVIGLAEMMHRRPLVGAVVAIGGLEFGLGDAFSWPVSTALRAFGEAIVGAIDRVRAEVVGGAARG